MNLTRPCAQCPWRISNQGKRHAFGFYTKANLTRLWNQLRGGGKPQSCHLTDPSHPDHVAVGARADAKAKECPGSVIVVLREVRLMANADGLIDDAGLAKYRATQCRGLTKQGILYWVIQRMQMAGVPFFGGTALPDVDQDDLEIGRPQ